MKRFLLIVCSMWLMNAAPPARGQVIPRWTRARRVCCLQNYGYAVGRLTSPVTAVSFDALPGTGELRPWPVELPYQAEDTKRFPLKQSTLTNDHCQVSQVHFVALRDGNWRMRFQCRQDPTLVNESDRPKAIRFLQNRFVVTVRVVITDRIAPPAGEDRLGSPVVTTIAMPHFWLRRGEVRNKTFAGHSMGLRDHFHGVQRLEVDLQYE